jgi:hypothetical protein
MASSTVDPFGGLEGADRDAFVAITEMLKAYGLETLAASVLGFIQQGYSSDTIGVLLQNTDAYKQRFAANESRRQQGLPVLSPAEYLATERAYRQIMSASGLPIGFYDSPSDFRGFLEGDMSPVELQDRVQSATDMVSKLDPATKSAFEKWYSTGDIIAYALDRERATSILDRQFRASQIAGAGTGQGVNLSQQFAERVAQTDIGIEQARQGLGVVSTLAATGDRLSGIYGGTYTQEDAASEVFLADTASAKKRTGLRSQERAQFAGQAGASSTSLSKRGGGQV